MSVSVDKSNSKLSVQTDVDQQKKKMAPLRRVKNNSQIIVIDSPTQADALFLNNVSYLNQCKKCEMVLVPGATSKIRVKCMLVFELLTNGKHVYFLGVRSTTKRTKHLVSTCLNCGTIKRFNFGDSSGIDESTLQKF